MVLALTALTLGVYVPQELTQLVAFGGRLGRSGVMPDKRRLRVHNGEAFSNAAVPLSSPDELRDAVVRTVEAGGRIAALFAQPAAGVSATV